MVQDGELLVLFVTFTGCVASGTVVADDSVCCILFTLLLAKGLFLLRLIVDNILIFFVPFPMPLLLLGLTVVITASAFSLALGESDFIFTGLHISYSLMTTSGFFSILNCCGVWQCLCN